jgi:hypothetical protein
MIAELHRKESHFHAFLTSLAEQSPCPFNWPQELLQAFNGTNLEFLSNDERFESNVQFLRLLSESYPDVFPPQVFNATSLKWAKGHYISRRYPNKYSYGADVISSDLAREPSLNEIGALVPILDILNHKPGSQWLDLKVVNGCLEVRSEVQVLQVVMPYSSMYT